MKIKIEMDLPIEIEGKYAIIKSSDALNKLFGSSSVAGNTRLYGVEKLSHNVWRVSIEKLRERYDVMQLKMDDLKEKISIMKQILESLPSEKKLPEVKKQKKIEKGRLWSDADDKIISLNLDKKAKVLQGMLSIKRTIDSIKLRKHQIRHNQIGKKVMIEVEKPQQKVKPVQGDIFQFSMIQANPKFMRESIKYNLIGKGELQFRDVNWIKTTSIWSPELWNDFTVEFMTKAEEIAKYFNVENKFYVETDENGTFKKIRMD